MHVAIIHHQFKLKGGMETYLLNLIDGFNNCKDNVTLHVYKQSKVMSPICEIQKKNLIWLPKGWRKYWFGSHCYKQKSMTNYDLRISLMRALCQDVIVCGGTHRGFLKNTQNKPSLSDRFEIYYEKKSYDSAGIILAHSKILQQELINEYNIPAKKIVMSYPPVDTTKFNMNFRKQRSNLREKFNLDPNKTSILFPSTGHKRKGFSIIVEALAKLSLDKYELIVAGNRPRKNNYPNIKYLGFVEDMGLLYTACDITILPSFYEPFGLAVVESIQCGTPVIISKFVGAKDLVSENEGIILKDLMPATLAAAIEQAGLKQFAISPDFAQKNNLTIDSHIQNLKTILAKDFAE